MPHQSNRLLHYTDLLPRAGRLPVVPWEGRVETYGADLAAATQATVSLPSLVREQWIGVADKLRGLHTFDRLYDLDLQGRGAGFRYEHFVKDPERLKDLRARVQHLQKDPQLWKDLTAAVPDGAGLSHDHLLALMDRLHYWDHGVFQASTPAAPLWWHGQPGLLHAFAPAVMWVEEALAGMAASGRFPLSESRIRSDQHVLYRGMKSYREAFPEGLPLEGHERFAMTLQSCSMTPSGSYAADMKRDRTRELVIVNPKEAAAVNMQRLIEAGFAQDHTWDEAMLPIRFSGVRALHDQRGVRLQMERDRLGGQGFEQLFVQAFELPASVQAALHRELRTGVGASPSAASDAVAHARRPAGQARQQGGPDLA